MTPVTTRPEPPRHLQVLIVDDDDVDRERVRRCLHGSGLQAIPLEAESGQDALSTLRINHVDCVLLDNHLGDTTGAELLKQMRQSAGYSGPIIMVTGAGSENLVVEAMREGASDYLPKPQLDAQRLSRAILRSLQLHASREAEQEAQRQLALRLRQQAETLRLLNRTFQDILDQTTNLIGYWDRQGQIRFGNHAHHDWLGIDPDRLAGMHVRDALGPVLYARHQPHIEAALAGQPQEFEHQMPPMAGHPARIVRVEYHPDPDEQGRIQGFYVNFTDLTLLVQARNEAQEVARVKSTFLANMSHEIRTPMNAIVGLSRLALEKALPDDAREDVTRVHEAAMALMGILDDILDHSKLEAGQLRIETLPVVLHEVLRRTVDLFASRLIQKRLAFSLEVDEAVPLCVMTDALRLNQILNNLVGNAVKFTEHGEIGIMVRVAPAPTPRLRFEVRDSGIGIAAARQSDLFTAFTQEDTSITRRFGGSGLGLSICRSLVQMMGGDIGVQSTPGQGSLFWFELPLVPAPPIDHVGQPNVAQPVLWISAQPTPPGLLRRHPPLQAGQWVHAADMAAAVAQRGLHAAAGTPVAHVVLDWRADPDGLDDALALLADGRQDGATSPHVVVLMDAFDRQDLLARPRRPSATLLGRPVMPETLVRALQQDPPTGQAPRHPPAAQRPPSGLEGRRVLVVDDNPLNQMVAEAFLQQAGAIVTLAGDGRAAVDLAQRQRFDAILMDMHMPVMDGLEATRRLQQLPSDQRCPVLAMTAAVLQADREQCLAAGMVDIVPKPIIAEHLLDTLRQWIRP
jgi:PAS domain S-box-containing protein